MIHKNNQNGVSSTIGVLLLVVITLTVSFAVYIIIAGILNQFINVGRFFEGLLIAYIVIAVSDLLYHKYIGGGSLGEQYGEGDDTKNKDPLSVTTTYEDFQNGEKKGISVKLNEGVGYDLPLVVAPIGTDPRNWFQTTKIDESVTEVIFSTEPVDHLIRGNAKIVSPKEEYGMLNAYYETGSLKGVTVYDSNLDEIETYELED